MAFYLVAHPDYARHDTGTHPENRVRYERTLEVLAPLALPVRRPGPIAAEALERVHPSSHGARIEAFCRTGGGRIDEDTVACPESHGVALLAAGGAIEGVRTVMEGDGAFVLCRPPGHHALAASTMGFCFFNNAALAVRHAQRAYGLKRVAVIDFDVHHGNGTEAIFYEDPGVLVVSTHQEPNWPGTGQAEDVGAGAGLGYNVNVPLPIATGDAGYARAFREIVTPVVEAYAPELIVLSAGYDAHWRDPLGQMGLSVAGYAEIVRQIKALADRHARGRLLPLLEGGYDPEALAHSVLATIQVLREQPTLDPLGPGGREAPAAEVEAALERARRALQPHWPGACGSGFSPS